MKRKCCVGLVAILSIGLVEPRMRGEESSSAQDVTQYHESTDEYVSVNGDSISEVPLCDDFLNKGYYRETIKYQVVPISALKTLIGIDLGYRVCNPHDFRTVEERFIDGKEIIERQYVGKPLAVVGKLIAVDPVEERVPGVPNEPLAQGFTNYKVCFTIEDPRTSERFEGAVQYLDSERRRNEVIEDLMCAEDSFVAVYGTVDGREGIVKNVMSDTPYGPMKFHRINYFTRFEPHGVKLLS